MKLGFYATLLGVVNGFIVLVWGIRYFDQNIWVSSLLLALGLLGVVLCFVHRFAETKAKTASSNPKKER